MSGYTVTEEVHDMFIKHGAVDHSIETETEDALILGDMMKYFYVNYGTEELNEDISYALRTREKIT